MGNPLRLVRVGSASLRQRFFGPGLLTADEEQQQRGDDEYGEEGRDHQPAEHHASQAAVELRARPGDQLNPDRSVSYNIQAIDLNHRAI